MFVTNLVVYKFVRLLKSSKKFAILGPFEKLYYTMSFVANVVLPDVLGFWILKTSKSISQCFLFSKTFVWLLKNCKNFAIAGLFQKFY